jgi:hypothetical protein
VYGRRANLTTLRQENIKEAATEVAIALNYFTRSLDTELGVISSFEHSKVKCG